MLLGVGGVVSEHLCITQECALATLLWQCQCVSAGPPGWGAALGKVTQQSGFCMLMRPPAPQGVPTPAPEKTARHPRILRRVNRSLPKTRSAHLLLALWFLHLLLQYLPGTRGGKFNTISYEIWLLSALRQEVSLNSCLSLLKPIKYVTPTTKISRIAINHPQWSRRRGGLGVKGMDGDQVILGPSPRRHITAGRLLSLI